jgi:gamma-glutamyltranspeptidase / glutathione hydrolase
MNPEVRSQLVQRAAQGRKDLVRSTGSLIVTSHPVATRAGAEAFRAGGTAMDAALAAAITQTVVEPQMSSVAGMMKLLYYDAAAGESHWLSGSHRTPLAPLTGLNAMTLKSGLGVAVPGWWAAFETALDKFGRLSRHQVMSAAIAAAEEGVEVYPQMFGIMYQRAAELGVSEEARTVFMPSGVLLTPGQTLRQGKLAITLSRLADEGSEYFYRGEFASRLVNFLRENGGVLSEADLASYQAIWREPARGTYRGYDIVTSGPPDGGLNIVECLNLVETLDLRLYEPSSESARLLYLLMLIAQDVLERSADQRDPDFVDVPLDTILSKEYARYRIRLLQMAGPRSGYVTPNVGTDHISAIDESGNVVVLMHTCTADPWVNGLFLDGVSLPASAGWINFSRSPVPPGARLAIDGAENIALSGGVPVLASGSPSGSLLPCVLQNMINILDFGIPLEDTVSRPRFGFSDVGSSQLVLEADFPEHVITELRELGMPFQLISPWYEFMGSYDAIHVLNNGERVACPDPRRTGSAEGV